MFKKIDVIIHIYRETRKNIDELVQSVYTKAVSLSKEFSIEEKWPESCGQEINLNNFTTGTVRERSVYLPFFHTAFAAMKPR